MQSNTKIQTFRENREFTCNKAGHILNLTRKIRYSAFSIFMNVSIHWKKYVFHLDKLNFELIGILRALIQIFGSQQRSFLHSPGDD